MCNDLRLYAAKQFSQRPLERSRTKPRTSDDIPLPECVIEIYFEQPLQFFFAAKNVVII